jgi:hypothetical protein
MNARVILATVATLLLLGCDSGESIPPTSEAVSGVEFDVVPTKLRVCDPPKQVRVKWNAHAASVETVKVFVVGDDGKETLLLFKGAKGSENTGPWTKAGTVFILKDADETRQLAKFVVGSEKCGWWGP